MKAREAGFSSRPSGSRPAVEVAGFLVRPCAVEEGDVLVLKGGDDRPLHVEATGPGAFPWAGDPRDPSMVYIEPGEDSVFTVTRDDGSGVVLVREPGREIYAYGFENGPAAPIRQISERSAAPVTCPAMGWLGDDDEAWLKQAIAGLCARGGVFASAVGVGLAARMRASSQAETTRALASLLSGNPNVASDRPHAWFRRLSEGQREQLEEAALGHVHALADAVGDLRRDLDLDGPSWLDRLRATLHARDDLEGLRPLFGISGYGSGVMRALDRLDREALLFIRSLPRPVRMHDERLADVARHDPSAWWANISPPPPESWAEGLEPPAP